MVQRLLRANERPDRAVGQAGAAVLVGPDRDEREAVVAERAPGLDQRVLLGHDRAGDAPGHRIGNAVRARFVVAIGLAAPALQQQHTLADVEQIHGLGGQVVEVVFLVARQCIQACDQAGAAQPLAEHVDVVAGLGAGLELGLLVREQGQRHIQIHHLDAEQVASIRQVALLRLAVPQDVAPGLGADVDGRAGLVAAQTHLQPAQAGLESVLGGEAALE